MMAPELYVSIYKEQFRPPGKVKRAELRPTSAHRRNNPQPRPDFLFPRPLQSNYRQARALVHPLTSVDPSRPFFPPVTHSSLHNRPIEALSNSENAGKLQSLPAVNGNTAQEAPSSGRMQTRHPLELPSEIQFKSILRTTDNQRNASLDLRQANDL
ncbi:uncharacterized protein LOC112145414 [Oryzias melastigma]|uniref:uncharacterized protein LOC112145414 n=1 Tax=Oryzias melastigma TaxID=30732 RepID=UPI00168D5F52|nr:uncharacterized protein LOC112145414 [Oryzias melastigma]